MVRVSRSPMKFFQSISMGRKTDDGWPRGQVSLPPDAPRYSEKNTVTHRRINFDESLRRYR